MLKDLSQVSTVHPAATCWATHEMLGFVRGLVAEPPSDVFAARDVGHKLPDLNATTVSSPVCKSLSLTTLCGFLDFRKRAVKRDVLAVAIGARNAVDGNLVLCPLVGLHLLHCVLHCEMTSLPRRKSVLTIKSQPASGAHSAAP